MTLDELKELDKPVITPAIAAQFLGCNPYSISIAARDCPEKLGFPISRVGNRTKIPRLAFIRFLETGGPWFECRYRVQVWRAGMKCRAKPITPHSDEADCYHDVSICRRESLREERAKCTAI